MLKKLQAPKVAGFLISLLITVAVIGAFLMSIFDPTGNFMVMLDKKWVDFILKGRPVQPHSSEVVIVTVDTKSVDHYGRWPWPRERMAQLIDQLNGYYNVRTIGFDIVFSEPEQATALKVAENVRAEFKKLGVGGAAAKRFDKFLTQTELTLDGDSKLGAALAKRPNGILGYFFNNDLEALSYITDADKAEASSRISGSEVTWVEGVVPPGVIPEGLFAESNIRKIYKGAHLSGFFNMIPDVEDGTVRRVHLLMRHGENIYPSLDLQMLAHYMGNASIVVLADESAGILGVLVGEKEILPNLDGSILLNYKGPSQTFKHISIYDVIEKNTPKEDLQDKIVLLGATEVGIYDLRTAPVGSEYPGVEVHATLLDNLLTDTYFTHSFEDDVITIGLILLVGLVMGLVIPRLNMVWGTGVTIVLVGGYLTIHNYLVNYVLSWPSMIFVTLEIALVWVSITLYNFLVSDRDKRFIKGAFQQYLSPTVIEQLMDNPDLLKLGGERRVCTAFFSDVAGFSSFSEKMAPEELVALLNVYLTEMSNIIMKYGGTVDKYEGDAIIAFFGAPVPYEDHPVRACMVTLEMQERLAQLREKWKAEGKPELKMRIGLNTGQMVVGNMGSENRFDYTMMGNSVNLAARLEGANKNYGTYNCCSQYTMEPTKEAIEYRELDLIQVMGIKEPVKIYEIVARKGQLTEAQQKGFPLFAKGLELYRNQQWDEAVRYFNGVLQAIPDDPPSKIFIERCQGYKASPPPADWNGAYVATSK